MCAIAATACFPSANSAAADGAWKERTEVVWSKETHALIRKDFRVWDPHPELDLDFLWEPRSAVSSDPGDILANGPGTLSWHIRGAADYDRQFIYSVFKGTLKDGRADGNGALVVLHTGFSYTGQWANGVMQGRGILRLENGDKYEGDFVAGRMHGVGRYASSDGSVYIGEFHDGLRDGAGKLMLAEGAYRTVWRAGQEVERQPIPDSAPPQPLPRPLLAAISNTVKLRLSLDAEKNADFFNSDANDAHTYDADFSPGLMTIHLGSKPMLDAWKENGKISSGEETGPHYIMSDNLASVFMKVDVENDGTSAAQITDASVIVAESATDPEPYLELSVAEEHVCNQASDTYSPDLMFKNLGWGAVKDARISYTLGNTEKRTDEAAVTLGTFDASKQTSIADRLKKLGVDTDRLKKAGTETLKNASSYTANPKAPRYAFVCEPQNSDEQDDAYDKRLTACFQRVTATGVLGGLKDFVYASGNVLYTTMAGRIEYQWSGSDGKINANASPFSINLPLVTFRIEMGEGSCEDEMDRSAGSKNQLTTLSLDRRNYQLHLPKTWNTKIIQGRTTQFDLVLSAAKSSQHKFQLVLQLADGSQVTSPVVDLSYFRPRLTKGR